MHTRKFWTPEQDTKLINIFNSVIDQHDGLPGNIQNTHNKLTVLLTEAFPNKTPKSCRQRYANYLNPSITKKELSLKDQDFVLKNAHSFKHKWGEMSKILHVSPNTIKNFYHCNKRSDRVKKTSKKNKNKKIIKKTNKKKTTRKSIKYLNTQETRKTQAMQQIIPQNPPLFNHLCVIASQIFIEETCTNTHIYNCY